MTQDISLDLLNKNGVYKITNTSKTGIFYDSVKEVSNILGYNRRILANMLNPKQTNINRTNLKYV